MRATAAREAALSVVTRVREREAYAHETLDAVFGGIHLDDRDRAFATRLAYGTVACRGTLDEAVLRFVSDPKRLEPRILDGLALSAYEMLFTATPHRAAVSEGVELVRSVQPRAAGLANAVLRKLSQSASDFPWGDPRVSDAALARLHAHPAWLADLWIRELGRDVAEAVMRSNNEPAPMFLARLEGLFGPAQMEWASEGPLPGSLVADDPSRARRSEDVARGRVLVMDAAAQFTTHAVRPAPGMRIVELGAGRGTKSLLIADLARRRGGTASVVAVDLHGFKLRAAAARAATLGMQEVATLEADATRPLPAESVEPESADVVLVDAPCSGLGTLRRHPDRRWRARPEEIEALSSLGAALLRTASSLVKPGGFVVYSTCTIARRENGDVIEGFLASPEGVRFRTDSLNDDVPDGWKRFVDDAGWFQSLPEDGGADGHFVARLTRD